MDALSEQSLGVQRLERVATPQPVHHPDRVVEVRPDLGRHMLAPSWLPGPPCSLRRLKLLRAGNDVCVVRRSVRDGGWSESDRHPQARSGLPFVCVFHAQCGAVLLHDFVDDGQAQTRAVHIGAQRAVEGL